MTKNDKIAQENESSPSPSSKIQLDNYQDLEYIESIIKNNFNYQNEEIKEQFFPSIFDILHQNIQINNQDFDEFYHGHSDNDMEHVNENLIEELEQTQKETDKLLLELCQLKKQIIPEIKSIYGSKLMENIASVPILSSSSSSFASMNVKEMEMENSDKNSLVDTFDENEDLKNVSSLSEELMVKFSDQLIKLKSLNENTPEVLAKLQRARMVLTEQADKLLATSDSFHNSHNNFNNSPNGNKTENLSEIFSRKFVAKRQENLAVKLRQQFY